MELNPISNKVVLICVDCLRNDLIQTEEGKTPFLNSLRENSLNFQNLSATATTTTPCVASIMTGNYSERNGINSLQQAKLDERETTLGEILRDNEYYTHAEVTGPLVRKTGLDRGFEEFNYRDPEEDLFRGFKENLLNKISSIQEKDSFFLYVHLWELHKEIFVPEEFNSPKYGETKYERALSALDSALKEIEDELDDETTLIITGDHGEAISQRNSVLRRGIKKIRDKLRYEYGLNTRKFEIILNRFSEKAYRGLKDHYIEEGHGENTFEYTSNVPLLIRDQRLPSKDVNEQVRQIDIMPTIIGSNKYATDGSKLTPIEELQNRRAYIRACGLSLKGEDNWAKSIKENGWKFIEYPSRSWSSELYNLKEDPKELNNIKNPSKSQELREKIPKGDKEPQEIEIKDKLRELGYL
ncbi:MAG: sulfatase-like hydrolase/transferase [Candidatus Nanohaloarchaea archaeon]